MKLVILIISALVLIMGCAQTSSMLKPLSINATWCSVETPCEEGGCYKFEDQESPICWTGNPCNRCVSGYCNIPESYPMQVLCTEEAGVANPASMYCISQGYNSTFRNQPRGQTGYCVFNDGSECEEWAYFRGECDKVYPAVCKDLCGDGTCQEVVCLGTTCPCDEDNAICPLDCVS